MALDNAKNFAKSTLAAGITSGATSLTVATGEGTKFPSASFNAVIWNKTDYADPSEELLETECYDKECSCTDDGNNRCTSGQTF